MIATTAREKQKERTYTYSEYPFEMCSSSVLTLPLDKAIMTTAALHFSFKKDKTELDRTLHTTPLNCHDNALAQRSCNVLWRSSSCTILSLLRKMLSSMEFVGTFPLATNSSSPDFVFHFLLRSPCTFNHTQRTTGYLAIVES